MQTAAQCEGRVGGEQIERTGDPGPGRQSPEQRDNEQAAPAAGVLSDDA